MIDHLSPCDVQTTGDCTCNDAPTDIARLLAAIEAISDWAGRNRTGYYDEAQDDVVQILTAALTAAPDVTGGAGEANGAGVAPVDDETKQDA